MNVPHPLTDAAEFVRKLTPPNLRKLADARISDLVVREVPRARKRVAELERRYPSAQRRELAQRLVDDKKNLAAMVGGVSGVFGLISVPADLLVMAWLELILLTDLATLYKVNLKAEHARNELLDLYGESNGVGPLARSGPRALGTVSARILSRVGLETLGRAMPLVAAPVSAWLNNQHIQRVGDAALHHYEGFDKAHQKTRGSRG